MDVEVLLKQASRELPLFLYGHSLGGMLVLSLALRNPELNLAGVITTSALIRFPKDRSLPAHKVFMIRLIGKQLEVGKPKFFIIISNKKKGCCGELYDQPDCFDKNHL